MYSTYATCPLVTEFDANNLNVDYNNEQFICKLYIIYPSNIIKHQLYRQLNYGLYDDTHVA